MQRTHTVKKSRFQIEKLEERIAPIVHPVTPLGDPGHPAVDASGGSAGGTAAGFFNGGPIGSDGHPVGIPVPLNNPGVGG